MSQNPNARRIENLEFGKKEERREDSFAHLINLPSPKGKEKRYIYILRLDDSNLQVARETLDRFQRWKRWKERKRIDIKIEGSGIIIRLIMRVERVFATANLEAGPRINNECVAERASERASACVKLA